MKTAKLVLGIVSMVFSLIVLFQSCAVGIGTALESNSKDTSGAIGIFVFLLMLIGGIIGVAARESRGGAIAATVIYLISGLSGVGATGIFKDLMVWGIVSFIFGAVFFLSIFVQNYKKLSANQETIKD